MIVFNEDAVAEAHAVIVTAAAANRVLLQQPPARRRLRVSSTWQGSPATAWTYFAVCVATPLSRCTKFSAVRSPVRIERIRPPTTASAVPGATAEPSGTSVSKIIAGR